MKKRREFTANFKAKVVLSILQGERSQAEICREYELHPNLIGRWKNEFLDGAAQVFEKSSARNDETEKKIAGLERLVGRLTMDNEILKKLQRY